ncbi:MAG: RDD family protein [Chloroflexi bacterium]|nr:RDD family protein [Chloroflexota bacterium]
MTTAAKFCPNCGESLAVEAKFCAQCGDQLSGVVAAGFWIRFAAVLVDAVILTIVNLVLSAIVGSTAVFLGLAVGIAYTIGFWTASGATPGKMMFGLKVLTVDGDPIGLDKAVLRYIGLWVNALTLGIGYLFIAFRKDKRGLHDLIAGTRVIRTGQ